MVPEYKRKESSLEFLNNFHKLRKETNMILMRDFGIKPRTYTLKILDDIYNIENDDKDKMKELMNKYDMDSSKIEKYPKWMVDSWRNSIRNILTHLGTEIELANSIYITNLEEYYERRKHWNLAIGYCNALKDTFQEILDCVTDIKVGAFVEVTKKLKKEINLLKGVRKADNKQKTFKRERKNIKHLKKDGVPREKAQSMYDSWRGAVIHRYGLIQSVESTDEYFMKVYGKDG